MAESAIFDGAQAMLNVAFASRQWRWLRVSPVRDSLLRHGKSILNS
jgi:hypothetical protein